MAWVTIKNLKWVQLLHQSEETPAGCRDKQGLRGFLLGRAFATYLLALCKVQ